MNLDLSHAALMDYENFMYMANETKLYYHEVDPDPLLRSIAQNAIRLGIQNLPTTKHKLNFSPENVKPLIDVNHFDGLKDRQCSSVHWHQGSCPSKP